MLRNVVVFLFLKYTMFLLLLFLFMRMGTIERYNRLNQKP